MSEPEKETKYRGEEHVDDCLLDDKIPEERICE